MRIEPDQTFAGVPAMRVRDMFRTLGHSCSFTAEYVQSHFEIPSEQAIDLVAELERHGFIEPQDDGSEYWQPTLKGSALALATAAKPIRRTSAERILGEFLERVEVVRLDPQYLLRVERIELFGSMAAGNDPVNDIDLGIAYTRKEPDDTRYAELAEECRRAALARGRSFPLYADWLSWPKTQVLLFLKSRSRALSLHPLDDWVLEQPGRRTIYVAHDDAAGQQLLFQTDGV